jgi:hypothetical protein
LGKLLARWFAVGRLSSSLLCPCQAVYRWSLLIL